VLPGRWIALLRDEDGREIGRAPFEALADADGDLRVAVEAR